MKRSHDLMSLILVRYADHVLYNRSSAAAMKPQIREAVGWLIYECDDYVTIAWDRDADPPTLKGSNSKASGLVLLRNDILEFERLKICQRTSKEESECHLNCPKATYEDEYALQSEKRKTRIDHRKGETAT